MPNNAAYLPRPKTDCQTWLIIQIYSFKMWQFGWSQIWVNLFVFQSVTVQCGWYIWNMVYVVSNIVYLRVVLRKNCLLRSFLFTIEWLGSWGCCATKWIKSFLKRHFIEKKKWQINTPPEMYIYYVTTICHF